MTTTQTERSDAKAVRYERLEETVEQGELGRYTTHGIVVHDGEGALLGRLSDVDPDAVWVDALVSRLNEHQAAPEHLFDIVCDNLGR